MLKKIADNRSAILWLYLFHVWSYNITLGRNENITFLEFKPKLDKLKGLFNNLVNLTELNYLISNKKINSKMLGVLRIFLNINILLNL